MKKFKLLAFALFLTIGLSAQEETTEETPKDKPVREPFSSGYLVDAQTTFIPAQNTLEYVIQHRFGMMENGVKDLWGIYAPGANVRMGLNYVVLKNVQVGWGIAKLNMYNDFNLKWTILEQTRQNTIPVAVALYGNMAIDCREDAEFGTKYEFTDRMSYFSQLIVGRKFTEWLSLQAGISFTHFNSVDSLMDHDKMGIHFNGRAKISPQGSFIFNYDLPLNIKGLSEHTTFTNPPKPNLVVGFEISTSTHAFQLFAGTSAGLLPQEIIMNNLNDFAKGGMSFGFVITRLWNF